jgi:hypothetical protein
MESVEVAREETEAAVKVAVGELVGLGFEAPSALLGGRLRVEVEVDVEVEVEGPMRDVRRGFWPGYARGFGTGASTLRGFVGEGER